MAYATMKLENPLTGQVRQAPVGFSWSVFFFSFFPAFFRSDWKWGFIMLFFALLTSGVSGLFFMFTYNKFYIKELVSNGFKASEISVGSIEDASLKIGLRIPLMG